MGFGFSSPFDLYRQESQSIINEEQIAKEEREREREREREKTQREKTQRGE